MEPDHVRKAKSEGGKQPKPEGGTGGVKLVRKEGVPSRAVPQYSSSSRMPNRVRRKAVEAFLEETDKTLKKLVRLRDESIDEAIQLRACIEILDRGLGKPITQAEMMKVHHGLEENGMVFTEDVLKALTAEELAAFVHIMTKIQTSQATEIRAGRDDVIDATVIEDD